MSLKLSNIGAKAMRARANMERIGKAYDDFNAKAEAHAADVESMTPQLHDMQSDLDFAVNVLGNSGEQEDGSQRKPG